VPFIISATTMAAEILVARDTAASALQKAHELLGKGAADVWVSMGDGRRYGAVDFDRVYDLVELADPDAESP
jgi:hypothetical protein